MSWLLLTHPLYLLWSWLHPRLWIKPDVRRFEANGRDDTLLGTFHRQRATWRGLGLVVPALLASLPAGSWPLYLLSTAGLLAIGGGYWLWWFNPHLNLARRLPYIGRYHVSWNPDAAWLDRQVWRRAWLQVRAPGEVGPPVREDLRVVARAGPLYELVLHVALLAGVVLYLLSLAAGWYFMRQ